MDYYVNKGFYKLCLAILASAEREKKPSGYKVACCTPTAKLQEMYFARTFHCTKLYSICVDYVKLFEKTRPTNSYKCKF